MAPLSSQTENTGSAGTPRKATQDHTETDVASGMDDDSHDSEIPNAAKTKPVKGPYPVVPDTVQSRTLDFSFDSPVQPVKATELTVWAIKLMRNTKTSIFRKVAADDAADGLVR